MDYNGRVTKLNLRGNQLSREFPLELADLSNPRWLYLGDNQLIDEIPGELVCLPNLIRLALHGNEL